MAANNPYPNQTATSYQGQESIEASVRNILEFAVRSRASDIHFDPQGKLIQVRYRIDGELTNAMELPASGLQALVKYVKSLAQISTPLNNIAQYGKFEADFGEHVVVFKVATLPTVSGEKITINVVDKLHSKLDFEELSIDKSLASIILSTIGSKRGIVLVTSPIKSDASYVLATLLTKINLSQDNIVSIENPIAYRVEGVNQTEIATQYGYSYPSAISASLSNDPNVIMVSDLVDQMSASMLVDAALSGKLVLIGMHAKSAISAVLRINDMGVEQFLIASTVKLVINTRRVRKLCPHCRKAYVPTGEELKAIKPYLNMVNPQAKSSFAADSTNHAASIHSKKVIAAPSKEDLARKTILDRIAADPNIVYRGVKLTSEIENTAESATQKPSDGGLEAAFYKPVGCEKCNHTGFIGQINLFEVLVINDAIIKEIAAGKAENELLSTAVGSGFSSIANDGMNKASRGITSISEVLKVL